MLTSPEKLIFWVLLILSIGGSVLTFRRMFRLIGKGSQPLDWTRIWKAPGRGLLVFFSQKTLFKTRPIVGFLHALVAWGFTLYMLVNLVDIVEALSHGFEFLPQHWLGVVYRLFVDLFSVFVLIGVAFFLIRRFITGDTRLLTTGQVLMEGSTRRGIKRDSMIVGLFIFFHVGFRLLGASYKVALNGTDWAQPAATVLSHVWAGFSPSGLAMGEHVGFWGAIGLILAFVPYFPYSKHAHLFMGPLNFMVSPKEVTATAMETMDFEDESLEQYGAATVDHLTQKQLLDPYACIMCNRCQDNCPAYFTGKELSPSAIEINKRYYLNQKGGEWLTAKEPIDVRLTTWMLSEEAAWSCTTCGFCVEVCPVGNEPLTDILNVRQDLVMMESNFPQDVVDVFNKLETYGNPWGLSSQDREKWLAGLDVPLMREKKSADYLYWVGCAGAYDSRGKDISRSMAKILNTAGVDYAVLGNEETCTGDSARRIGNEYLFQMMADQNKETLSNYTFKTIVTQCPHCLTTLKNDYKKLGMDLNVIHHSQLIDKLIKDGKLQLTADEKKAVTFHDPCYLGRHNGEYDAPRDVVNSVLSEGNAVKEMDRSKNRSFCCGAGGGNMWYEINRGERINIERFNEAAATGAETVAVACNFCLLMMEDAMKVTNREESMDVRDIAELVAGRLPD